MDASPGGRLQEVLADFAEQHRALSKAREQMKGLSVTAQSRDGVVEATVGADGRASAIRFTSHRFRAMPGLALAASVLEALTTARTEAAARATAIVMSLESGRSARLATMPWSELVAGGVPRSQPVTCWRRMVRQARSVAADAAAVPGTGRMRASRGVVGSRGHPQSEALTTPREAEPSRPQRPLWGRDRPGPPLPFRHAPLPVELRDAIVALGDAVCGAVGGGLCSVRGCARADTADAGRRHPSAVNP
ncbi:YbaB/EbfC family nucleoid-associated protein [Streptomyces anthocyanicus]|uniref:YbaB/EbfC family nucleoid-associated protein n=1 Tax=Streptomyces anthocyanicus TaxID=68174 RepID=UPI00387008D8